MLFFCTFSSLKKYGLHNFNINTNKNKCFLSTKSAYDYWRWSAMISEMYDFWKFLFVITGIDYISNYNKTEKLLF